MRRREPLSFPPLDKENVLTDLRGICRERDRCVARVDFMDDYGHKRVPWIITGQAQFRAESESGRRPGEYRFEAYLDNATDFEHDSAYAIRLPLVGVQFVSGYYHTMTFVALVDPSPVGQEFGNDFGVPRAGYDPRKHPDAQTCRDKRCHEEDEGGKVRKSHIIVPQGFYVPPYDRELHEFARARRVEVTFGPARKDDK